MTCKKLLTIAGIVLFAVGGSSMDSLDMRLPAAMTISGALLVWIGTKEDRHSCSCDGRIELYQATALEGSLPILPRAIPERKEG